MGFSAGGFLTTFVATEAPDATRPNFIAPVYGAHAPAALAADAPPMFTMVAADDPLCLEGCLQAFGAWRAAGRPAELHVYAQGGHGFGMHKRGLPVDSWIERLGDWMASYGWLPKPNGSSD
jgi:acetyl esterase/lipase